MPPGEGREGAVRAGLRRHRIGLLLEIAHVDRESDEQRRHRRQHRDALLAAADHLAEREAQCGRDDQDGQHFQEVRQRRGVLIGMGRVGVEEAAAVGAQQLDRFLRGHRTHRQRLGLRDRRVGDRLAGRVQHRLALRVHARLVVVQRLDGLRLDIG